MRIAALQLVQAANELHEEGKLSVADLRTSFAHFLERRKGLRRAGKMERALEHLAEKTSGIIRVSATSAAPLGPTERTLATSEAARLLGLPAGQLAIEFREDPAVIGGIRFETQDWRYDHTLSRALSELRKSL